MQSLDCLWQEIVDSALQHLNGCIQFTLVICTSAPQPDEWDHGLLQQFAPWQRESSRQGGGSAVLKDHDTDSNLLRVLHDANRNSNRLVVV